VTAPDALLDETAEDLFENAPCGYLSTALDGTILRVNRTFEEWTGLRREQLVGARRFQELLTAGGRIYHETHYAPLLQMQGSVREIAVDIVRADGSRLPALINSVVRRDDAGRPRVIRTTVFDATDRRRYEQELLAARQREQDIALKLQRSLLSGPMPDAGDLAIGVVYRPAVKGLEVGGDWYDAFWLEPPHTVGVVVGDVVGRGLEAAATMGQLRSAVRALASTRLAPGALLERLDGYSRRHAVGQMATVVYAEVDLRTGTVRYACAGHPPPAVLERGAEPRFLSGGRSTPLDAYLVPHARAEDTCVLGPGSTFVIYTDGLIERSDRPLGTGMEALLATLGRHGDQPPDVVANELTRGLVPPPGRADDVCVLALRLGHRPTDEAA
jgi:phosphoserine phosphatase RsbU/P